MLDDLEAGPAEGPPRLPAALGDIHVEAGTALHTGWGSTGHHVTGAVAASPCMSACSRPLPGCPQQTCTSLPPSPRPHVLHCWLEMGAAPPLEWGSQAPPPTAFSTHVPTAARDGCAAERQAGAWAPSSGAVPSSPCCQAAFTLHGWALLSKAVPEGLGRPFSLKILRRKTDSAPPFPSTASCFVLRVGLDGESARQPSGCCWHPLHTLRAQVRAGGTPTLTPLPGAAGQGSIGGEGPACFR